MRFGDLAILKVSELQNGRCVYRMNKTDKLISMPIPEAARRLLAPYLVGKKSDGFALPFLKRGDDRDARRLRKRIGSNNAMANVYIKEAAERAGVEPEGLTMHVTRHSFAAMRGQRAAICMRSRRRSDIRACRSPRPI